MFDGMEHVAKRIVDKVIDTYGDNLAERGEGTIVVESRWMKDMQQEIIGALTDYEYERLEAERPRAFTRMLRLEQRVISLEKENAALRGEHRVAGSAFRGSDNGALDLSNPPSGGSAVQGKASND